MLDYVICVDLLSVNYSMKGHFAMRKFIKQFFPFDIQRLYMQRTYGIFISVYLKGRRPSPIVEVLIGMLPYGLVRSLFDVRPDNKRTSPLWMKLCEPGYRFTRIQHTRFMNARLQGLRDCKELIEKNKNLIVLINSFFSILAILNLLCP